MSARVRPLAAVTVVGVLVLTGCGGFDASKSGGGAEPIHVHIATGDPQGLPSSTAVETFAREIEERSGGSVIVDIRWRSFLGKDAADPSAINGHEGETYSEVARQVQDDEAELAIVPDFAWIDRGSESVEALKVPFLIDSVGLMREVARRFGDEALADLPSLGVIPLAVMPEALRHPVGFGRAIRSPADFDGHRLRMSDSASGDLLRAWGAEAVEIVGGFGAAVASGDIDGADSTFALASTLPDMGTFTADISYLAKFTTIVASSGWWDTLSDDQRQAVQDAAIATREEAMATLADDVAAGAAYCEAGGTAVHAGREAVRELEEAVRAVGDAMRTAPSTSGVVQRIEQLKAEFPPAEVAAECAPPAAALPPRAAVGDPEETAAFPQGTFRAELSGEGLHRSRVSLDLAQNHASIWTLTFRDGRVEVSIVPVRPTPWPTGDCRWCWEPETPTAATRPAGSCSVRDGPTTVQRSVSPRSAPAARGRACRPSARCWGSHDWVKVG